LEHFSPIVGMMIQSDSYFSGGLKPPTRCYLHNKYSEIWSIYAMSGYLLFGGDVASCYINCIMLQFYTDKNKYNINNDHNNGVHTCMPSAFLEIMNSFGVFHQSHLWRPRNSFRRSQESPWSVSTASLVLLTTTCRMAWQPQRATPENSCHKKNIVQLRLGVRFDWLGDVIIDSQGT